ncbi:uncharacterized protein UV8b_07282 [Ustilaginoidea virens]|uniref:Glycosyl transferase family protein n=1 Tax=Ustilaginoidea virens TaxID=1159556 RepID=A0A8E5MKF7_USTVR|nr:uncharacterized protein UV8b_07282 [Ustilaginoidea virens]QUC23041.1 hypothetical protein UV8b_07282 [Ustilaginoidea virens]
MHPTTPAAASPAVARPPVPSDKAWASLITSDAYLPGLLTLNHALRGVGSSYPLVALYTPSLSAAALAALAARAIPALAVPALSPRSGKSYPDDPRFDDCWTKLVVFSLVGFARLVLLDADMLPLRNMDELMDLPLDADRRVFAAAHACVCNPLGKPHYPRAWVPRNCAFTAQHADPDAAQVRAPDAAAGLGALNSGLLVVRPSHGLFDQIVGHMHANADRYTHPDQDLLADLYRGRWVALPYVYNALKTMPARGVHDAIWRPGSIKNVHYILSPKPWEELDQSGNWTGTDETHAWWVEANKERLRQEEGKGGSGVKDA